MNKNRILRLTLGASLLLFAACSQNDFSDGQGEPLPEGKYPLQIASVSMSVESSERPWGADAPQTRVTENTTDGNSSVWQWDGTEYITVKIGSDGTPGKYQLITEDGEHKVVPSPGAFWKNFENATVNAWYASPLNTDETTVDLSDQSEKLAYVLQASPVKNVAFGGSASLSFSHQLAKVRVKLTGEKASEITAVKVKGYPSCTIDKTSGTVTNTGIETYLSTIENTYNGEIYWEANLAPQDISITDFVQLTDKKDATHICSVSGVSKLDKANYYVFNIEVKSAEPTEIQPGADGNYTVNEGDNVIIDGKGTESPASININGTATVTLHNVVLKNASNTLYVPVKITDGTATIILEGENTITGTVDRNAGPGIQLSNKNSNVIIIGTTGSKLTVSAGYGHAAIGSRSSSVCGDIRIESATIDASTSMNYGCGASAAIGSGSAYGHNAGCGEITIIDSDITAEVTDTYDGRKPAVIGSGDTDPTDKFSNFCKGISITLKTEQSKNDFLGKLTGGYVQVGAGQGVDSAPSTCDTINWYKSDGTTAN